MAKDENEKHVIGDFGQKALIVKDNKVLMCKGIGDTDWDFPGGRLHVGEDPKEGLMRELEEELGAASKIGDPFYATVWYGAKSGLPRIFVVYLVTLTNPDVEFTIAKHELEEITWVSKDTFESMGVAPDWMPVLQKFFSTL